MSELVREWFSVDGKKKFKPWKIDTTGVYHALHGAGFDDPDIFTRVIHTLRHCLNEEVIE